MGRISPLPLALAPGRWAALLAAIPILILSLWISASAALDLDYCASINTGSTSANYSIYQTAGLCHDFCLPQSYAFAIVQYQTCWCSDGQPAASVDVAITQCDTPCPGYPSERCGSREHALFGYIALGNAPSSTVAGPSSAVSTDASSAHATTKTETVKATVTVIPPPSTTITAEPEPEPTPPSIAAPPATSMPAESAPDRVSLATPPNTIAQPLPPPPPPPPSVITTDDGGTVRTVTATAAPTVDPAFSGQQDPIPQSLNTGQVVGIIVGVLGALGIVSVVAICYILSRRRRRLGGEDDYGYGGPSGSVQPSHGSSSTAMPGGGDHFFSSMLGRSPGIGPGAGAAGAAPAPIPPDTVDPRLDPLKTGLYARSMSRESINSLQDGHDYSRRIHQPKKVLRATNPDPVEE